MRIDLRLLIRARSAKHRPIVRCVRVLGLRLLVLVELVVVIAFLCELTVAVVKTDFSRRRFSRTAGPRSHVAGCWDVDEDFVVRTAVVIDGAIVPNPTAGEVGRLRR